MSKEPGGGRKRPEQPPWGRRSGESEPAFQAFTAYRDAGPGRSLSAVAAELGKSVSLLGRWSSRDAWVTRAEAWDLHLQRERDKAAIKTAVQWEARRQAAREERYILSEKLMARGLKMLRHPLVTKEVTTATRDGHAVTLTIITPTKWTFRDALATLQVAAELQDMALGDPEANGGNYEARITGPSTLRIRPDEDPEVHPIRRADEPSGA